MSGTRLDQFPLHLGLGARAIEQTAFTGGMEWYEGYIERNGSDGVEGRLVTIHEFDADWDSWEVHPEGDEVVLCLAGSITLHQELADGSFAATSLAPGEYAINSPGTWHTVDVPAAARVLFITAGWGTQHRPR